MRKIIYATLAVLMAGAIFIACSKQENEDLNSVSSIKVKGIVAFNTKTKKSYVQETNDIVNEEQTKKSFNEDYDIHSIKSSFTCDKQMPAFSTEKELKSYLLKNRTKTNGVFEFYIDNELAYSVQIINGEKFNEKIVDISKTKNLKTAKYACSYAGIRACAIDGIHNQNWYEMVLCVGEGLGCVADWYINCTIDNC